MPTINFIRPGGHRTEVAGTEGDSIMRAALDNGIYEISGECGGVLACATCHVQIDPAFAKFLPPMSEDENDMLDFAEMPRTGNSRLSCQIIMTPELDGVTVKVGGEG